MRDCLHNYLGPKAHMQDLLASPADVGMFFMSLNLRLQRLDLDRLSSQFKLLPFGACG